MKIGFSFSNQNPGGSWKGATRQPSKKNSKVLHSAGKIMAAVPVDLSGEKQRTLTAVL
jgi:hypothetical protein